MMHHLAHGPTAVAVGCVELSIVQVGDSCAQAHGQQAQCLNIRRADTGQTAGWWGEASDRVPEVVQFCHATHLTTSSREDETAWSNPVSGGDAAAGPGSVLRVMVMNLMMVVGVALVMVMRGGS
jgi:hypothetical protein